MPKILFVDDYYEDFKEGLEARFGQGNVLFLKYPNIKDILKVLANPSAINLALLDDQFEFDENGNRCPARSWGKTLSDRIRAKYPKLPIFILTKTARETTEQFPNADAIVGKPSNTADTNFYDDLFTEAAYWSDVSQANWEERLGIVNGENPQMVKVARSIVRFGRYRPAEFILVTGETGTGKEEVCKALHREAGFSAMDGSYQVVHCGQKEARDLRIDLGGFPRQARAEQSVGVLEILERLNWRGTLVFDEIDDLSYNSQNVPNRLLERQPFQQENNPSTIFTPGPDLRFVVTAQRDLEQMVREGKFRPDLWRRIHACTIHLPPLRQRKEAIPSLFQFFTRKLTEGRHFDSYLRPEVEEKLKRYDYPGNIGEFRNILVRAISGTSNSPLRAEDIHFSNESIKSNNLLDPENAADLIIKRQLTWEAISKMGIKRQSKPMEAILKKLMEIIVDSKQEVTEKVLADYLGTTREVVAQMIKENNLAPFKKGLKATNRAKM